MTTTVLPCPKCHAPLRMREGETTVQCVSCGSTIEMSSGGDQVGAKAAARRPVVASQEGGEKLRQIVLSGSLVAIALAFVTLAMTRRHTAPRPSGPIVPETIYTAPPPRPELAPTAAGEIAWVSRARAPIIASINAEPTEDIFGFFRVWDGSSAWVEFAGAFDGATFKPLWRTEQIDPQLTRRLGLFPYAVAVGSRLVVSDTSALLRVYALATGEKQFTLRFAGPIMDICRAPDSANRVWVDVDAEGDSMVDLVTEKSELAPRPSWCPMRADHPIKAILHPQAIGHPSLGLRPTFTPPTAAELAAREKRKIDFAACNEAFDNAAVALGACHAPDVTNVVDGFRATYELTDGTVSVALGTKDNRPFAVSTTKKATPWSHPFIADDSKATPRAPSVADIAQGRLYAVYERTFSDAKLTAIDAHTGEALWETPLVGSLGDSEGMGRGAARELVATATRVYVARAGGGLDVFDASSGKPLGTIGKQ